MGKVIHEMRYKLRFDKDVNNIPWKVRMETEFMKEHSLVYLDKEVEKEEGSIGVYCKASNKC
jgi:hypothetical protein